MQARSNKLVGCKLVVLNEAGKVDRGKEVENKLRLKFTS